MTAWAVVALALAGSFLIAVAAGRRLARSAAAMPTAAVAFGDPDEIAAMDRERDRLAREADAARLLAELRRRAQ